MLDELSQAVIAIDMQTGVRSIVSGGASSSAVGDGPRLFRPTSLALDATKNIAYVTDDTYDALIAVDLLTGYRQLVSK